jgi:hypothetical protein
MMLLSFLQTRVNSRFADRSLSALVALGLAVLVWLYARSRDPEVVENVPIPVEISLAPGQADRYDLEINGPPQVPVSFRGPPSCIRELRGMLQRGELHVTATVVVPEDRQKESSYLDTVRIDAADVQGPPGVTPLVVEGRNRIPVTLRRLVERRLPVRLDPAPDERASKVVVEPARVRVRGPQDILDRLRAIPTEPYLLPTNGDNDSGHEVEVTGPVSLVRELGGRPVRTSPPQVTVHFTLRPRQKVYELTDIPVHFLCPPNFPWRPEMVDEHRTKVTLQILGPVADGVPIVGAFVDLTARKFAPGLYPDELLRLQLPTDCQLAHEAPRAPAFRLVPAGETLSRSQK